MGFVPTPFFLLERREPRAAQYREADFVWLDFLEGRFALRAGVVRAPDCVKHGGERPAGLRAGAHPARRVRERFLRPQKGLARPPIRTEKDCEIRPGEGL